MSVLFEELDYVSTRMGPLSLRRRRGFAQNSDIYEIKLGDEFLMTSLCADSEIALAEIALADVASDSLDVVVGGLGLGYTARAVLADTRVKSVIVIESVAEVIDWHEKGLLPLGRELMADPRCRLVHGDFFAMVGATGGGLDPDNAGRTFDAILVDIDHSPSNPLHPDHAALYERAGILHLSQRLNHGGVFGLWSNDPPDQAFSATMDEVFETSRAEVFVFPSPLLERNEASTIYIARRSH